MSAGNRKYFQLIKKLSLDNTKLSADNTMFSADNDMFSIDNVNNTV
jgi:hypothetical protein